MGQPGESSLSDEIVLDTETTGVEAYVDRVIEIAVADWRTGAILLHSRVNPQRPIPPEVSELTGIADADVAGAPLFAEIGDRLAEIIHAASVLIGYNPFFDRAMIAQEFVRMRRPVARWPKLICGKRLWDKHEPKQERNLRAAHDRFVGQPIQGWHGALADTMATRAVVQRQIQLFSLDGVPWEEFDPEQARWCGGTNHLVWRDGEIVVNFGKHEGKPVLAVDRGYWRWILSKGDFPIHVRMVAQHVWDDNPTREEFMRWIAEHLP